MHEIFTSLDRRYQVVRYGRDNEPTMNEFAKAWREQAGQLSEHLKDMVILNWMAGRVALVVNTEKPWW